MELLNLKTTGCVVLIVLACSLVVFVFASQKYSRQQPVIISAPAPKPALLSAMKSNKMLYIHQFDIPKLHVDPRTEEGSKYWSQFLGKQIRPGIFDDCSALFKGVTDADVLPEEFKKVYDPYKSYMSQVLKSGKRPEGSSLHYVRESRVLWNLAHNIQRIHTVCETGFNTGESAIMWLTAKPTIKLFSFDLGEHPYAKVLAKYIKENYPDRFNITWGDSMKTLPKFVKEHQNRIVCDLLVVDGGHFYKAALSDFDNLAKISYSGALVVLDNYPDYRLRFMQDLGGMWEEKRQKGELVEIFKCTYGRKISQGFSFGVLNK